MPTTASVKQLAAPVLKKHGQYDAYRGNLVEPIQCSDCVDVLVMKERFKLSVKQVKYRLDSNFLTPLCCDFIFIGSYVAHGYERSMKAKGARGRVVELP